MWFVCLFPIVLSGCHGNWFVVKHGMACGAETRQNEGRRLIKLTAWLEETGNETARFRLKTMSKSKL